MSYSLMIAQLLILRISNLIKDIIKTLEFLKMHILMIIFYAFLTVKKSLMFKYKFSLTHILRIMQQLLSSSTYLIQSTEMTFVEIISNLIYFQKWVYLRIS